jgi:hypothetical protein
MPQRWSLGKGTVGFSLAMSTRITERRPSLEGFSFGVRGRSKAPSTWAGGGFQVWDASKCECSEPRSKAYMTTTEYTFLVTLITERSFESVTQGQSPNTQARGVSEQNSKKLPFKKNLWLQRRAPSNASSRRIARPTPSPSASDSGFISAHLVAVCKQTGGGCRVSWLLR